MGREEREKRERGRERERSHYHPLHPPLTPPSYIVVDMSRTLPRTASTAPPVLSPDRMITAIGERGNRFLLCVNRLFAFTGSYMITVIAVIGERGERQDIDVCVCVTVRECV